jgi:hypothetical protein
MFGKAAAAVDADFEARRVELVTAHVRLPVGRGERIGDLDGVKFDAVVAGGAVILEAEIVVELGHAVRRDLVEEGIALAAVLLEARRVDGLTVFVVGVRRVVRWLADAVAVVLQGVERVGRPLDGEVVLGMPQQPEVLLRELEVEVPVGGTEEVRVRQESSGVVVGVLR